MAAGPNPSPDAGPPEVVAHGAALRSLARALVGEQAADDAVQEAWLRYLERRPAAGAGLGGWLATVLRRLVSNDRRDAQRRERRERDAARPEAVDEPALREKDDTLRGVVAAVLELEPAYREVVMLRWFEGLAPREIAVRLGIEPHVVHTRLSRAHSKLREKLDRDLGTRRALSGLCALAGLEGHPPAPLWPRGAERWAGGGEGAILVASKLVLVSGAAALVLCGAVWLAVSGAEAGEAADVHARAAEAAQPGSLEFADAPRVVETGQNRSEAPAVATPLARADLAPWDAPAFEYELKVVILDALDFPRDRQPVYAAPAGHTLNHVGETDPDGSLVLRWRGFQPTMELDLTPDSAGSLNRVRVAAGSQRVALRHPSSRFEPANGLAFRVTAVAGRRVRTLQELPVVIDRPQDFVACERDADGRILWVEPALCDVPQELLETETTDSVISEVEFAVGHLSRASIQVGSSWNSPDPSRGRVAGRVLDSEGRPVEGAVVVASRENLQRAVSARADAEGRFELDRLEPAEWNLRAGGGDHGRAQQLVTVVPGGTFEWEPRLDRGMELKGRLLGPDGMARADWIIEVECDDRLEPLVDATRTDAEGRFAIPNLPPRALRVFARPSSRPRGFALVVAHGVLPGELELELVASLADLDSAGSISASVSDAEGGDPRLVRARAWRDDTARGTSGESVASSSQVATSDGGRSAVLFEPTTVEFEALGPGWHTLELSFRGRAPLVVPRVACEPGRPVDLGGLVAPVSARLALGGPKGGSANCRLVFRGDTVELRCEIDAPASATLRLRDGEYEITRKLGDASVSRRLLLDPGATTSF